MQLQKLLRSFPGCDFNAAVAVLQKSGWLETGIQESGESLVLKRGLTPVYGAIRKEQNCMNFYKIAL